MTEQTAADERLWTLPFVLCFVTPLMIAPQVLPSRSMKALNSAGEPPPMIRPCLSSASLTAGSFITALTSALMRLTTSAGVPAGANRPFQASASKPG